MHTDLPQIEFLSDATKRLALLDSNVWSQVANPAPFAFPLQHFSIVGSYEILEELRAIGSPMLRQRLLTSFFEMAGSRILRPFQDRVTREASMGKLVHADQYFNSAEVVLLKGTFLSQSNSVPPSDHAELGEAFAELITAIAMEMRSKSTEAERFRREAKDVVGAFMFAESFAVECGLIHEGEIRTAEEMSRRIPSLWAGVLYLFARLAAVAGERRGTTRSDRIDNFVVSCAPYVDVIVTQDRALRSAAKLMAESPLVVSSQECLDLPGRPY